MSRQLASLSERHRDLGCDVALSLSCVRSCYFNKISVLAEYLELFFCVDGAE
jgi:hypothetical protein